VWRLTAVARVFPRALRDSVYDLIARNRYRWFGRHEACRRPTADESAWFLP
jgi:predicted DCC family thiol-disulfide oxidoreductase YuxK